VFVADGLYFDRMFKMVLIFTECLKWSSFSQFVFYLVLFVTLFKSVTKHCTSDTVCITLLWGVLRVLYRWLINVNFSIWEKFYNYGLSWIAVALFIVGGDFFIVFLELEFVEEITNTCHFIVGLQSRSSFQFSS